MPNRKQSAMEKPKNFGASIAFVWSYLRRRKPLLFLAGLMVLFNIGATLAGTAMLQPIIDNFLEPVRALSVSERFAGLLQGVITLLCIYLVAVAASYLQMRLMMTATQRSINDLRRDLFDHLQDLSVRYYDTHTHGEMMSRFSNDVDTLNDALANSLTSLFSSVITLTGILALMISKSIPLTILTLLMTPVMFFVAGRLMRASSKYFVAQQANLGRVNGYVEEIITGQKVVKVFCHEPDALAEFDRLNGDLQQTATTAQSYSGLMMPVMMNISTINYALVAMIGGVLAVFGHISVGGLVVFLQLTRQFSRPITEASSQYNAVITAIAGAERIQEVMREPAEDPDPPYAADLVHENGAFFWQQYDASGHPSARVPVRGDVKFEDVTFGYNEDKTILKHISLYAKPGQKIAFVGSTGAGKTTITNLLTRFYDIKEGIITIDGIDIRKIKISSLRKHFGQMLQDVFLFSGTIRSNILLREDGITDAQIMETCRYVNANYFIDKLEYGLDETVRERGNNFSAGQRQLLSFARTLIHKPSVMILDEATANIDTETELLIQNSLERMKNIGTMLIVAHRLSTIQHANNIIVLSHGRIIEEGNHQELLAAHGRYYQLYMLQYQKEQLKG